MATPTRRDLYSEVTSRIAEIKDKLRIIHGMTIRRRDGGYRVNFRGGDEATAYYTPDLEDAFATGVTMARQRSAA